MGEEGKAPEKRRTPWLARVRSFVALLIAIGLLVLLGAAVGTTVVVIAVIVTVPAFLLGCLIAKKYVLPSGQRPNR